MELWVRQATDGEAAFFDEHGWVRLGAAASTARSRW
ncbi:hypothetical protein SAMN05421869_109100 [Nonomuraea jiangxiensis]|uniref:Uncharacterized protein n=1 Tax=Nonomuraea jiangxiensis TaxID=633440 RepID=A0A1G8RLY3_9ACTN|nr:hypothetical protein SAMN05421869_109100 [Nonomuraea jiangxiensis]